MSQYIVARCRWGVAVLLVLVLGPSMSVQPALRAAATVRHHAVMKPFRNPDGSLAATRNALATTFNWSGYALMSFEEGTDYRSAKGSWVVPTATFVPAADATTTESSSNWVGIGGTCTDPTCAVSDQTLIQLGTESDAFNDGSQNYFAWYELLPANSTVISDQNGNPLPVSPGDVITASLECVTACIPYMAPQTWVLSMVDQTQGWTFTQDFSYVSSTASAEWIEEAPSDQNNHILPLADFGQSSFTATSANGVNSNLDFLLNGMAMTDAKTPSAPVDQAAGPSPPVGGDAFSVCWAAGATVPSCTYSGLPAPNTPQLVAAVLPSSRSVVVDTTATVFATIINPASAEANSCTIHPFSNGDTFNGRFFYQTTDPTTNRPTGTPNTPVNIPANGSQSFFLGLAPELASVATNIRFSYVCQGELPVSPYLGINTLAFSASTTPVPDVIALVATTTNDGIVHIPRATGIGAFSMATDNVGADATLTVSPDTNGSALGFYVTICETVAATGACMMQPGVEVTLDIPTGGTPTFAIFVSSNLPVPFNPATNRIFVRFKDGTGTVRGSSSVAVTTQ